MRFTKKHWQGILLCLLIAVPSWFFGKLLPVVGGPVFAILIGMAVSLFIKDKKKLSAGITFVSKKILQLAVVLLGFGMNFSAVLSAGRLSLPIILTTISTALLIAFLFGKIAKLPGKITTLIGVGSSICGGSAIAATAPVIGADDDEIAQSISVIFLFNVIAALIFPTIGGFIGLTNEGFGLFAGTAVNDTSSVTAAAAAWDGVHGSNTLAFAAVVKLTRTLAIIPITLLLALYRAKKENKATENKVNMKKIFPWFILFFIFASLITTFGTAAKIPHAVFEPFKVLSKFFIVMAMSAIGLNTNIVKLVKSGLKPIVLGFCCWIGIAAVSLLMQSILGIW